MGRLGWRHFWWGEAPEWSRNAREAIGVNGEVTCSGQKAAEPRSMVCHLLNGVDVVGGPRHHRAIYAIDRGSAISSAWQPLPAIDARPLARARVSAGSLHQVRFLATKAGLASRNAGVEPTRRYRL